MHGSRTSNQATKETESESTTYRHNWQSSNALIEALCGFRYSHLTLSFVGRDDHSVCSVVFAVLAQLPRSGNGGARPCGGSRHDLTVRAALLPRRRAYVKVARVSTYTPDHIQITAAVGSSDSIRRSLGRRWRHFATERHEISRTAGTRHGAIGTEVEPVNETHPESRKRRRRSKKREKIVKPIEQKTAPTYQTHAEQSTHGQTVLAKVAVKANRHCQYGRGKIGEGVAAYCSGTWSLRNCRRNWVAVLVRRGPTHPSNCPVRYNRRSVLRVSD
jgi:hypothetical protein